MNIKEAKEQIKNAMTAYFTKNQFGAYVISIEKQRPVFLMGPPGIGKTAIVNAVLKKVKGADSRMLDFQLSMKEHDDFFLPSYNVNKTGGCYE